MNFKNKRQVKVIFEIKMTNVGSWNGRWSGEGQKYTIAKTLRTKIDKPEELINDYWHYNFGDGWALNVICRLPEPREKPTNNFLGYE